LKKSYTSCPFPSNTFAGRGDRRLADDVSERHVGLFATVDAPTVRPAAVIAVTGAGLRETDNVRDRHVHDDGHHTDRGLAERVADFIDEGVSPGLRWARYKSTARCP
jgi:hypothetical protein